MNHTAGTFRAIIAGGGTGGHLFPGIAVAREIEKRFDHAEVLFVTGLRKMESEILSRYGYHTVSIRVEGIKGRGWKKGLKVISGLPGSFLQSVSLIKAFSPVFVLGVGGYASGPVCLAARMMGVPTAIHEQNAVPGLANRLLSRFVDCVFISFPESRPWLKGRRHVLSGTPVREELFSGIPAKKPDSSRFTVLVVGGSQGAMAVNRAFAEALEILESEGRHPHVIHQTGETDFARVQEDYRKRGIRAELHPFIRDMAAAYHRADLVVGRAGASTIFELAALGKPSVLIPYPFATHGHQEMNARCLVQAGAAEMIRQEELTGECLAKVLTEFMNNPDRLKTMGIRALTIGRKDAAEVIVDHLLETALAKKRT